ncbi:MAG TPA: glycyl-radical enzyme activating protein [Bacteroidales bacterium]|nr:glycyl-radical enzyme activating protein [Bacteroidales bacterium]
MIFNIQRYSTHDGEGIRTIIFYKGCTLHCQWCSNPESQSFAPEIMFDERLCKKFGDCIRVVPGIRHPFDSAQDDGRCNDDGGCDDLNRSAISSPDALRNVCMTRALTVIGEEKTTSELVHEIEKDLPFYLQSNGGVTLSGGEPLAQNEELISLLKEMKKRKIRVAVETSLHTEWKKIHRCLGFIDTYLVDLKHTNSAKFKNYTGGNLELIMRNLKKLVDSGEHVIIRIPVIPGFNHTKEEILEMIDYTVSLHGISEIHFIPYHVLGHEKYRMLGRNFEFNIKRPVDHCELKEYLAYAHLKGFKTKIGG